MKLAPIVAIIGLAAAALPSHAAIVYSASLQAADGSAQDGLITSADGTLLSSGTVATGTFSISDSAVAQLISQNTAASFAQLAAAFTPFGTDNFVIGTQNAYGTTQAGSYVITADFAPSAAQIGSTIYTLISNGSTLSNGTQYGLLQYGALTADPAAPSLPNQYNLGVSNATAVVDGTKGTAILTNADLAVNGASVSSVALTPIVPEPSVALLGLLGVAGLVRRRR